MRSLSALLSAMTFAGVVACNGGHGGSGPSGLSPDVRPRSAPIEFVGMKITRATNDADFLAVAGPIFGEAARGGTMHHDFELQHGVLLTVTPDARTADQVVISLDMMAPETGERRTIARLPASLAYGQVFIDTVRAALAETQAHLDTMKTWHLEYNSVSPNGGRFILQVAFDQDTTATQMSFETQSPSTSLSPGEVNMPAFSGEPYEKISGTVFFELSRDEFDFFSKRAYGITGGAGQNFDDFQLLPHRWLRLTITPRLADELVDVGFEAVTLDGRRLPLAKAPASFVAGEQFRQNVFLMVDNMNAQEAAEPGSSTPFEVPFHYDDPEGGGVVSVIAQGEHGVFRIAYAVESPIQRLRDVEFVPYSGTVDIPAALPPPMSSSCADLGSTEALSGTFRVKFDASPTVRSSMALTDPLRGPVWADIYRAADVTISGPRDGAMSVASFHVDAVDVTNPDALPEQMLDFTLPAGDYQILGFMDIDGNADPANPQPDPGDPVTLPIGRYKMECLVQPVTVEFALLLPDGF